MADNYGKFIDGKLAYAPTDYTLPDGGIIKNFTSYPNLMQAYGYKLIVDNPPQFDATTSYLVIDSYAASAVENKIVINYTVKSLMGDTEPTLEEKVQQLQTMNELLTGCILELSELIYSLDSPFPTPSEEGEE